MTKVARLIERIKPEHYRLSLDVRLAEFRYTAAETITFTLPRRATSLTFHAAGFSITSAQLDTEHHAAKIDLDPRTQTVTFTFDEAIIAGRHTLAIDFNGTIEESLHGFYRSKYQHEGKEHFIGTTQFEAVHAREAFVCIDEPAAKTVFELSLTVERNETAIANTNIIRELQLESGRRRYDFAPTPKMSTYLVAYIIGQFESRQVVTKEGVLVRGYATPGKGDQLAFALEVASGSLSFFTNYFGIPYPLPKLDMIAIPDFASGAMENWGAITYRETALLLDPANASLGNRQRVAEVVAHELAHQWFGNLVTMAWWNDLWLNEGFAAWIEALAQEHLFPEWDIWTQFVDGDYASALSADSLASTQSLRVEINDPLELDSLFDPAIVYAKGASIIRMLQAYLGAETFRRGLHLYLTRHQYASSVTSDLWNALAEVSGQPVAKMMETWVGLAGYPIVTRRGDSIQQQRFLASTEQGDQSNDTVWPIPLQGLLPDGSTTNMRLMSKSSIPTGDLAQAIKLNPGQSGFYRVAYDEASVQQLSDAIARDKLSTSDRYGVISDLYATTEAGITSSTLALKLTGALRQESNYVVWSALSEGFGSLRSIIEDEGLREQLTGYGRWLVAPNLKRLGWQPAEDESYFDSLMRPLVLGQAIAFDDEETLREARVRFDAHVKGTPVPPDLRSAVYTGMARRGTMSDFDQLLALYRAEAVAQERLRLLVGLCRFRDPEIIARSLELGFSEDVRPQDTIFVLAWGLTNHDGRELTWQFIQDKWPVLLERYGSGGHMLDHIPHYLGMAFASHPKAEEVAAFFAAHPHPAVTRPAAQAVERINLSADWYQRDRTEIEILMKAFKAS